MPSMVKLALLLVTMLVLDLGNVGGLGWGEEAPTGGEPYHSISVTDGPSQLCVSPSQVPRAASPVVR